MIPNLWPFFGEGEACIPVRFQKKSDFLFLKRFPILLVKVGQVLLTLFKASAAQVAAKYS